MASTGTEVLNALKNELAQAIGEQPTEQEINGLKAGLYGQRWARPLFHSYGAGVESARRWDAAFAIGERNAARYSAACVAEGE